MTGPTTSRGFQKVPRLHAGDRLAAVTLSWGGPGEIPHRYEAGKRQFEQAFDVSVLEMPHTLASPDFLAEHPQARVDDLHAAVADPEIAGIISTIGGDDSIRLLPLIDLELVAAHPKIFLDTRTPRPRRWPFSRPAWCASTARRSWPASAKTEAYCRISRMAFAGCCSSPRRRSSGRRTATAGRSSSSTGTTPENQSRSRVMRRATGWRWHGGESAEGPLVVGCLEVLDWLRGTAWWPDLEGTVLAIETSEEAPTPDAVQRFLRSLAAMGDLYRIAALLVGRPGGADLPVEDHPRYDDAVISVVRGDCELGRIPIATGLDFGHTDPIWTLPQGLRVRVDPAAGTIAFLESGVA